MFTLSMLVPFMRSAPAFLASAVLPTAHPAETPAVPREQVRHLLFGTPAAVQSSIRHLHKLGYAEPNDWSRPISTGRANEVMAILTKRVEVKRVEVSE